MSIQDDICCNIKFIHSSKTIASLILYCVSGTLLTLVNKLIVVIFPYVNVLLVLQNGIAVILLVFFSQGFRHTFESLPELNVNIVKLWMPLVLLFVMMLTSSLFALMYVTVPTFIVMRNFTTLSVALLEYVFLNNQIDGFSTLTLIGMLLAAILYSKHDLTFNIQGYTWLSVNIIGTSAYQIYMKKIIHLPVFENIGSIGMSYYNNFISLPILLICACIMGELTTLLLKSDLRHILHMKNISIILLSGILGFSLSVSAFALNKLISATSMMVANNANKFFIIVLSQIFVQFTLDLKASIGAISVLFLGCLYSQAEKPLSTKLIIMTVIVFTACNIILEYKNINISIFNSAYHSHLNSTS
ncbi:unnamed protein product [Rotaria socialis]|uniref:Sugar phosphate transporter domain-containing protein n=1 Tax=Rotaria socialis TaxID=392032 RepID=A0A818PYG1_9BILA|nr:unnamed protein product [Rotaria socialis]